MSDFFTAEERRIYKRTEGGREVFHDPDVVWRSFLKAQSELGVRFDDLTKRVRDFSEAAEAAGDDEAAAPAIAELAAFRDAALRDLAEVGRRMFGKTPLAEDGSGWTELEGQTALLGFVKWREELRLKLEAPPSGSPGTDGPREV